MSLLDSVLSRVARAVVSTRMTQPVAFTAGRGAGTALLQQGQQSRGWRASAVATRCMAAIVDNAASLPLQILDADGVDHPEHPVATLWRSPNPLLSSRIFGAYLWGGLEANGERFVYVDRGENDGDPIGLWPIFGQVEVMVDKQIAGEIVGYRVTVGGGKKIVLVPREVLWLRYPDPDDEWGVLAPLASARHALSLDANARAWQDGEFANGARMSSVVYLGDLSEDAHNAAVAGYRANMEGAGNAGKALFVSSSNAAKVERMNMTPAEMGWLDTRKVAWEEVMLALGVPFDYLMGGATYENRAASRATLWSDTIIPKLEVVADEIVRQLLAGEGLRARFDTDDVEALRESEDAKFARIGKAAQTDVMTIDEMRAMLGHEPLPGGIGEVTITAYRMNLSIATGVAEVKPPTPSRAEVLDVLSRLDDTIDGEVVEQRVAGLSFAEAQRVYDRHERIGNRGVARLAARQERMVLNALHALMGRGGQWAPKRERMLAAANAGDEMTLRAAADDLFDPNTARDTTREELRGFVEGVWADGASSTGNALGVSFDLYDQKVTLAMDARLDVLADQVTTTTRQVLEQRVLVEGVQNGETIDQLAARVRATFSDLSTWRAQTIARTETVGGYNAASNVAAAQSDVVKGRTWLATDDGKTRDSHVNLDGTTVRGFETRYSNGCLHPGDPSGPAAETINCRCVEQYVL